MCTLTQCVSVVLVVLSSVLEVLTVGVSALLEVLPVLVSGLVMYWCYWDLCCRVPKLKWTKSLCTGPLPFTAASSTPCLVYTET